MPKDAVAEVPARMRATGAEWRETLAHLGERLMALSRHGVEEAGDDMADFSRDMTRESREILRDLRRQVRRAERAVRHSTRSHPDMWITGFVGAAAAGLLVGLWLRETR